MPFNDGDTIFETDFITEPTGGDDSGKLPLLNANGQLDNFVLPPFVEKVLALGNLSKGVALSFVGQGQNFNTGQQGSSQYRDLEESNHYARYYIPFTLLSDQQITTRLSYVIQDAGSGANQKYDVELYIYEYDAGDSNKRGNLVWSTSDQNVSFTSPTQTLLTDERNWDISNAGLVVGTKYTMRLEYDAQISTTNPNRYIKVPTSGSSTGHTETGSVESNSPDGYQDIYNYAPVLIQQVASQSGCVEGLSDDDYGYDYAGFCIDDNVQSGDLFKLKMFGIIDGFSGLTVGSYYTFHASGLPVLSGSGTNNLRDSFGIAISTTQMLINHAGERNPF